LTLGQSHYLCAPTEKLISPGPISIDHFQCYDATGPPLNVGVSILDQFQSQTSILLDPFLFCNPVDKNGEGIANPIDHLTCYDYTPPGLPIGSIPIRNQFFPSTDILSVNEPFALCLPSQKEIVAAPALSPVGIGLLAMTMVGTVTWITRRRRGQSID
jgi:hypothetical protein